MKLLLQTIIILIIFLKTGNLLSDNNLFDVNNIILEKKNNDSNKKLANKAIKKGFDQLIKRVLLKEDVKKVSNLKFSNIRELVTYYNISDNNEEDSNKLSFNVSFDRNKMHDLFLNKGISYSDIKDKDFFILPIEIKRDEIFIFTNNYFYKNWNEINQDFLIDFILPIENIEIIQLINQSGKNLLDINLNSLFKEFPNSNIAIALIEENKVNEKKIYLNTRIQNKIISKSLTIKKNEKDNLKFNQKIIFEVKEKIIDLVKSQNLIDIGTPSFLNVKLNLDKKNNLVLINSKIKNIDLIENVFVQEFNKNYVNLKIKYLGKIEKIINKLKNKGISLKLINDQWFIKTM